MDFKRTWTEADVTALIGQTESVRREFKAGVLFDREPESKWVEALSKEVSALANTEGGELVLGIDEDKKSKPRVAIAIDGVTTKIAPERLQQLIEGNVSPYLPGMRVHRIKLSATPDRVVFVVQVPQGNTAYQANDGRYYGRSEFEAKYLPDHEVRLRMQRGRVAQAKVEVSKFLPATGYDDLFEFTLAVVNTGEVTIREFALVIQNLNCEDLTQSRPRPAEELVDSGRRSIGSERRFESPDETTSLIRSGTPGKKLKLFPGDRIRFPLDAWYCLLPTGKEIPAGSGMIGWTLYLNDAAPSKGTIDLGQVMCILSEQDAEADGGRDSGSS